MVAKQLRLLPSLTKLGCSNIGALDSGAAELLDAIAQHRDITTLDLSYNQLGATMPTNSRAVPYLVSSRGGPAMTLRVDPYAPRLPGGAVAG